MKQNKNKEKKSDAQLLYEAILEEVKQGKVILPDDLKVSFFKFSTLSGPEKHKLIDEISRSEGLPKVMRNFVELIQFQQSSFIDRLPEDIAKTIATFEDDKTLSALALTSKESNRLFKTDRLPAKFLQQVAFGRQDNIEKLFTLNKKKKWDKEIQELLCKSGKFTDYSGRTFYCTAYEYTYWAKDRHMCRMLERHMDEDTKAMMLKRCEAIEKDGLKYTQNGEQYCTKHFDLISLKMALKVYVDGYDNWLNTNNWDAMKAAWMKVGLAQRDVPAHVIHEYCWPDRSFDPTPEFNEDKLPRVATFYNNKLKENESLFPLVITSSSGLGVDFALVRGGRSRTWGCLRGDEGGRGRWRSWDEDLLAVSRLDEVRTEDLKQSLDNLKPKELGLGSRCLVS